MLQYISSSIDVIINLKFEDIENKMIQKTQGKGNDEEIQKLRESMLDQIEINSLKSGSKEGFSNQKKNIEETPPQIKAKVKNN